MTEHALTIRDRKLHVVEQIIDVVCQQYDLTRSAILCRRRTARVAWPRQVAMFLARELTGLDFHTISELFWRDCHGTSEHAYHSIRHLLLGDDSYRKLAPARREELCAEIECLRALLTKKSGTKPTRKKP